MYLTIISRNLLHVFVTVFLAGCFYGQLVAQPKSDDCGCGAALAKDTRFVISRDKQAYAFLSLIDEKLFEEFKADSSATIGIPIAKGLLDASGDFNVFNQKRKEYFEKVGYTANRDQEYIELQTVTSEVAYPFWSKCVESCATNKIGLYAWKAKDTPDRTTVIVYYHGAPGSPPAKIDSSVKGGKVDGAVIGKLFAKDTLILNNGSLAVIIEKVPKTNLDATVSAGGFVDTIFSGWLDESSNNTGVLKLERPSIVDTQVDDVCAVFGTPYLDSKNCEHAPCSDDGKWQAADTPVSLTAPKGHVLRNPRLTSCTAIKITGFSVVMIPNDITCYEWTRVNQNSLLNGETSAFLMLRTWTVATERRYCANCFRRDTQTATDTSPITIPASGTFVITMPRGYTSGVLQYKIAGTNGVIKVGAKMSDDGILTLVSNVQTPNGTGYYQYKIKS